jgi:hypothetical protein
MHALRLMTFNVQMLPWIADVLAGTTNDAPERADRVADAIEALPSDRRPHVIAFNEVFDEDGRDRLLQRLSGGWPHIHKKIDDGGVLEDSGLMLFSSLPFHTLPNGDTLVTGFYSASADDDAKSNKGFGIVQVGAPAEVTTIVFTHMQASYTAEDQYRDVRVKQFDQIKDAVDSLVGVDPSAWRNVILVGDLNVRGDSGCVSDEWTSVFEVPQTQLFDRLDDGWRTYMHVPGDPADHDPGYTNLNFATGLRQRLDYQCVAKPIELRRSLVTHYMHTPIRNASDHWSLEAVIQQHSARCTPSDAVDVLASITGVSQPEWPTTVRVVPLQFVHEGSYQWLWVSRPGTFTLNTSADVEHELFAMDDFTFPLERIDKLNLNELPAEIRRGYREAQVDPDGSTYITRTPFFVALRTRGGATGPRVATLLEHRGESAATAIRLKVHDKVESGFPAGQTLGADDLCWFKATPPRSFAGTARDEKFTAHNPTGQDFKFARLDTELQVLDGAAGANPELTLTVNTPGGDDIFLTIARSDQSQVGFTVSWFSPMSYVMVHEPLGLYVDDESGTDFVGDDEIILSLSIDGAAVLTDATWDDADTGERWPGLDTTIRQKLWTQLPGAAKIGFHQSIDLSYVESDIVAQGFQLASARPLGPSEPDRKERRVNMPVPDTVKDGRYTFYCTITKYP